MTKRYKVLAPTEPYGDGKTVWAHCGMAFENQTGITVQLVSLPLQHHWNGRFVLKPEAEADNV